MVFKIVSEEYVDSWYIIRFQHSNSFYLNNFRFEEPSYPFLNSNVLVEQIDEVIIAVAVELNDGANNVSAIHISDDNKYLFIL